VFQAKIEAKSIDIIAQRQPLAIDLREIISALRISNDLERIGDLAKNIGKRVIAIGDEILPMSIIHGLEHMTRLVMEQFKTALDSFAAKDVTAALAVRKTYKLMRPTMHFFMRFCSIWARIRIISLPVHKCCFASKTLKGLVTTQPI